MVDQKILLNLRKYDLIKETWQDIYLSDGTRSFSLFSGKVCLNLDFAVLKLVR